MGKTKLIALSGVCGAVAEVCMLACSVAFWAALILSVVASIAVVIPLLVDSKALMYSILVYAVAGILGGFAVVALGNVVYVAPMVAFAMPFAIVKVYGERGFHPIVKWVFYYVLLEFGIGLTLLAAYSFAQPLFNQIVSNDYFYLLLAALQLVVIPYDLLMRGCLMGVTKILHKIVK